MIQTSAAPIEGVSRRSLLQGISLFAATAVLPVMPFQAHASADGIQGFASLSQLLTGRAGLPAAFMEALFAAFSQIDAGFAAKVDLLNSYISTNAVAPDDLQARLKSDPAAADLAGLPALILTGWYLGVAGSGDAAICVTYTQALANQEVSDVLRPPSYAYGAYGSWAAAPV